MVELLLNGIFISLSLAILALTFGFIINLCLVYLLNTERVYFVLPARALITFVRGVPLIVQIFLIYYGSAQFEWIKNSPLWPLLQHPFFCATIALAINSGAYTAILLESNIQAIPKGEKEAARVFKLSYYNQMRHIILPRALENFWPPYANEVIMTLKNTSLVSTITLMDLMGVTRQIISERFQSFEMLGIAGLLYLMMSGLLTRFFRYFLR